MRFPQFSVNTFDDVNLPNYQFYILAEFEAGLTIATEDSVKEITYHDGGVDLIAFGNQRREISSTLTITDIPVPIYHYLLSYLMENSGKYINIVMDEGELIFGADINPFSSDTRFYHANPFSCQITSVVPKDEVFDNCFEIELTLLLQRDEVNPIIEPTPEEIHFLVEFNLAAFTVYDDVSMPYLNANWNTYPVGSVIRAYTGQPEEEQYAHYVVITDNSFTEITNQVQAQRKREDNTYRLLLKDVPEMNLKLGVIALATFKDFPYASVTDAELNLEDNDTAYNLAKPKYFKEGLIASSGLEFPDRSINMTEAYGVEQPNGFTVKLSNTARTHIQLIEANLNIAECSVWVVLKGVPYKYCSGLVDSISWDAVNYTIKVEPRSLLELENEVPTKLLTDVHPDAESKDEGVIHQITTGPWAFGKLQKVLKQSKPFENEAKETTHHTQMAPDSDTVIGGANFIKQFVFLMDDSTTRDRENLAIFFGTTYSNISNLGSTGYSLLDFYLEVKTSPATSNTVSNGKGEISDAVFVEQDGSFKIDLVMPFVYAKMRYGDRVNSLEGGDNDLCLIVLTKDTDYAQDPTSAAPISDHLVSIIKKKHILTSDWIKQYGYTFGSLVPQVYSWNNDSSIYNPLDKEFFSVVDNGMFNIIQENFSKTTASIQTTTKQTLINPAEYVNGAYKPNVSQDVSLIRVFDNGTVSNPKNYSLRYMFKKSLIMNPIDAGIGYKKTIKVLTEVGLSQASNKAIPFVKLKMMPSYWQIPKPLISNPSLYGVQTSGINLANTIINKWGISLAGVSDNFVFNDVAEAWNLVYYLNYFYHIWASDSYFDSLDMTSAIYFTNSYELNKEKQNYSEYTSTSLLRIQGGSYDNPSTLSGMFTKTLPLVAYQSILTGHTLQNGLELRGGMITRYNSPHGSYDNGKLLHSCVITRAEAPNAVNLGFKKFIDTVSVEGTATLRIPNVGELYGNNTPTIFAPYFALNPGGGTTPDKCRSPHPHSDAMRIIHSYKLTDELKTQFKGQSDDSRVYFSQLIKFCLNSARGSLGATGFQDMSKYGEQADNDPHNSGKYPDSIKVSLVLKHKNPLLTREVSSEVCVLGGDDNHPAGNGSHTDLNGYFICYNLLGNMGGHNKFTLDSADSITGAVDLSDAIVSFLGLTKPVFRTTAGGGASKLTIPPTPATVFNCPELVIPKKFFNEEWDFFNGCTEIQIQYGVVGIVKDVWNPTSGYSTDNTDFTYRDHSLDITYGSYDFGGQLAGDMGIYLSKSQVDLNNDDTDLYVRIDYGRVEEVNNLPVQTPQNQFNQMMRMEEPTKKITIGYDLDINTPKFVQTRFQMDSKESIKSLLEKTAKHTLSYLIESKNTGNFYEYSSYYRNRQIEAMTFDETNILRDSIKSVTQRKSSEFISKIIMTMNRHWGKNKLDTDITVTFDPNKSAFVASGIYTKIADQLNTDKTLVNIMVVQQSYFKTRVVNEKKVECDWFFDDKEFSNTLVQIGQLATYFSELFYYHSQEAWSLSFTTKMEYVIHSEEIVNKSESQTPNKLTLGDMVKYKSWFLTDSGDTSEHYNMEGIGMISQISPDFYNGTVDLTIFSALPPSVLSSLKADTIWTGRIGAIDNTKYQHQFHKLFTYPFKNGGNVGFSSGGMGAIDKDEKTFTDGSFASMENI